MRGESMRIPGRASSAAERVEESVAIRLDARRTHPEEIEQLGSRARRARRHLDERSIERHDVSRYPSRLGHLRTMRAQLLEAIASLRVERLERLAGALPGRGAAGDRGPGRPPRRPLYGKSEAQRSSRLHRLDAGAREQRNGVLGRRQIDPAGGEQAAHQVRHPPGRALS